MYFELNPMFNFMNLTKTITVKKQYTILHLELLFYIIHSLDCFFVQR